MLLPEALGGHWGKVKWVMSDEYAVKFMYPGEDGGDHWALAYLEKGELRAEDQVPLV